MSTGEIYLPNYSTFCNEVIIPWELENADSCGFHPFSMEETIFTTTGTCPHQQDRIQGKYPELESIDYQNEP